ncbi:MAG TPA: DUF488 domain-containing protein [Rhodospirillales bacterium]|nr:DUF488 domain-containing protein [Rhodospirillales bacterium]
MTSVATIGYEGASLEDFLAVLAFAGVTTLIDVREAPISRRKGFSKNILREALENIGIDYIHLVGLGNPKNGRDAAREGRLDDYIKIFSAQMTTSKFKADLERAAEIASEGGACLMCYERDPNGCHRKIVSEALYDIIDANISHLGVRKGISKNGGEVRSRTRFNAGESAAPCG